MIIEWYHYSMGLTAVLGLIFRESVFDVLPAIKKSGAKFNWHYYFHEPGNQVTMFANLIAVIIMLLMHESIFKYEDKMFGGHDPISTGAFIGVGASWALRKWVNSYFDNKPKSTDNDDSDTTVKPSTDFT